MGVFFYYSHFFFFLPHFFCTCILYYFYKGKLWKISVFLQNGGGGGGVRGINVKSLNDMLLAENQKGINVIQWYTCTIENQKGAITIDFVQQW